MTTNSPQSPAEPDHVRERRQQILQAAMVCFARRGFHQTTMQDISSEAQISVGLIYRYFDSKDAVISRLANEHKEELWKVITRAREAPTLYEALEILFTSHCPEMPVHVEAPFVLDVFAEAGRNPLLGALLRDVLQSYCAAVTELIASSEEARRPAPGLDAAAVADLVVDAVHGLLLRDIADGPDLTSAQMRARQVTTLRRLFPLLFPHARLPEAARSESRP